MKFARGAGLLVLAGMLCAGHANAQTTISNLFNTGVDAGGAKVSTSSTSLADLHYTEIVNNFSRTDPSATFVISDTGRPGSWITATDSNWIAPDGADGSQENGGNYTVEYRTTFTLPANAILSSVNIAGQWASDNAGLNILVNGTSEGLTNPGFGSFTNFTLPTGSYITGTNTLDFVWQNTGGPGGLNVRFTTKQFNTTASGTPEPGSLALLAGLTLSGSVFARRRKKTV